MADDAQSEEGSISDRGSCRRCDRNYELNFPCEVANLVIRGIARLAKLITLSFALALTSAQALDSFELFSLISFLVYSFLHEAIVLFAKDVVNFRHDLAKNKGKKVHQACHPRNRCLRVSEWILCLVITLTGILFISYSMTKSPILPQSLQRKSPTSRAPAPTLNRTSGIGQHRIPLTNPTSSTTNPNDQTWQPPGVVTPTEQVLPVPPPTEASPL